MHNSKANEAWEGHNSLCFEKCLICHMYKKDAVCHMYKKNDEVSKTLKHVMFAHN